MVCHTALRTGTELCIFLSVCHVIVDLIFQGTSGCQTTKRSSSPTVIYTELQPQATPCGEQGQPEHESECYNVAQDWKRD